MPVPPPELLQFFKDFIPFNRFLGIQLVAAEEGWCRLELPFREELFGDASRPALHGGVISTLIDTCGGFAVFTCVPFGEKVSTIDLRVDYLRPGRGKYFIATARVVRKGSRIAVVHMELHNDEGELIATGGAAYVVG